MADVYDVYFGTVSEALSLVSFGQSELELEVPVNLAYNTTYYWRVDVYDGEYTTTGDEWSFTTVSFAYPRPSTRIGGAGEYITGDNGMVTLARLVAASGNKVYYEI